MATTYPNVVASGSYTADTNIGINGNGARALHIVINVTDLHSGTPSVTPRLQLPDGTGGTYELLAGTAITTVSETVLKIGLHYTAAANTVSDDMVPDSLILLMDHADAQQVSYTVAVNRGT